MSGNKDNKEPVRSVIIGKTGSGKSSLANVLLGQNRFISDPSGSSVTSEAEVGEGHCKGNAIKVVDTPGFFETNVDDEVNKREIIRCLALSGKGPNVFLYCIEIGRFTKEDAETFRKAKRMFGDSITDYMWIVFTYKDKLDKAGKTEKAYIDSAPPDLTNFLKEVGNKHIFINSTSDNLEPALNSLSTLINSVKKENFYTIKKYEEGIEILERLVKVGSKYRKAYTQWKKKREDIIQQFSELETELNCMVKDVRINKVAGSLAGITGSTLGVVGVAAAPLTMGTSLALTVAGAIISITGGVTGGGALVRDVVTTKKRKIQIDTLLREDHELMDNFDNLATSFRETLSKAFLNNEIEGVINYVLGKSIIRSDNKTFEDEVNKGLMKVWEYFLKFLKVEKKCLVPDEKDTKHDAGVGAANAAVTTGGQVAKTVAVATDATTDLVGSLARSTATAVKVTAIAGIVASVITLPLDLYTIIQNSKDLHLNTKHQLATFIHDIRENLKENMDDYDQDRDVLFIFVEEVQKFLYPPST